MKQQTQPSDTYWPFPSQCPPIPWTPEQQRQYAEEQLKRLPDAPM